MAREGTRSATGNSRPRVFDTVPEVATTKKRATANTGAKRTTKKAPAVKASKPVGVTKKKAAVPAKKPTVATKAKGVVKKVEGAVTGNPEKKAAGTKKIKGTDVAAAKKGAATKKK
ncbi:hypothetical protein GLAREA_00157 [Glarea lozoyensis ATCC 20868]|uniref:Uncharacterized protein n=1 Tax=Glarea lozoyensis (strain ATCC 20868 / MF5171) TaxID=1116229 RepID=S3CVL6_GLAL2|nr:uncharacterized protein GLAREA_00157 [Glarea lozoyensis ATCC 20868]EPE28999.1 hypothetical protein GLAREA_00157 [Glarea lozoyensis ATCC 20868]